MHRVMQPVYAEALLELSSGRGNTLYDVRHKCLESNIIGAAAVYPNYVELQKQQCKNLVQAIKKDLNDEIIDVLLEIKEAFKAQKNNKENDSPQRKAFRKILHLLVDESRKLLGGVVKDSLQMCQAYK